MAPDPLTLPLRLMSPDTVLKVAPPLPITTWLPRVIWLPPVALSTVAPSRVSVPPPVWLRAAAVLVIEPPPLSDPDRVRVPLPVLLKVAPPLPTTTAFETVWAALLVSARVAPSSVSVPEDRWLASEMRSVPPPTVMSPLMPA